MSRCGSNHDDCSCPGCGVSDPKLPCAASCAPEEKQDQKAWKAHFPTSLHLPVLTLTLHPAALLGVGQDGAAPGSVVGPRGVGSGPVTALSSAPISSLGGEPLPVSLCPRVGAEIGLPLTPEPWPGSAGCGLVGPRGCAGNFYSKCD